MTKLLSEIVALLAFGVFATFFYGFITSIVIWKKEDVPYSTVIRSFMVMDQTNPILDLIPNIVIAMVIWLAFPLFIPPP